MPAEVGPPLLRQRRGWRPGHGLCQGAAWELGNVQKRLDAGSDWQVLEAGTLLPEREILQSQIC